MADEPAISLQGLEKNFRVSQREPGLWPAIRALFRREWVEVAAVAELSFEIQRGERVGFLGPNGAGKTTTLKLLAGLLYPSGGRARVLGFDPADRRPEFLRRIALVMGQKRQLSWDLPSLDTFELNRVVFDVPRELYERRLAEMTELLDLGEVVRKPVRTLSLGERMKCELVAALLHAPEVLFLDEPTIGMDVSMQLAIREFIREYHRRHGATLVLTSHYMEDVAALCERILVIDEGRLCFDGSIGELVRRIRPLRRVAIRVTQRLDEGQERALEQLGQLALVGPPRLALDVDPERVPEVVARLLAVPGARDLEVQDAPLEEVMRELFARRASVREGATDTGDGA
ncbi:ABC transporter, ATP-binding protein [Enhygromyxa salina]|uniref:ABC transporter, ATP-binding protein n=1 Tax=Enhygromyxa salina TaxID=215803 RepID=A0A0C1ZFH5_9BACT|nr:ATP-binding cassette domain-containing protein [Enhygromyxa salina]KIG16404.1 ABC transporter, ATP-binding protein [Enhygromyxa salina]